MLISDLAELQEYLADIQAHRAVDIRCELSPALAARVNDAALTEALLLGLPMAQGIKHRIVRSRGKAALLTAKLRYRDGVRMLAGAPLTHEESAALEAAQNIAANFRPLGEEERFQRVYDWVCRSIRYVHTAPGQKGYERLVGAVGALLDGQANCQGFADALYLLCGLCGIPCEYRIGRGTRQLHVWSAVCIGETWREVDASKGARGQLPQSASKLASSSLGEGAL